MKPSEMKCEGSCEAHSGDVRRYIIEGWDCFWDYCDEAFAEDKRRGLKISLVGEIKEKE